MSVKINTLEIENVKRIKALQLKPSQNGLTIIGGNNRQGKTSVLDSIAWALGGDRFRPSQPKREDSFGDPHLRVTLDNGLVVERHGQNSDLRVTDPDGHKGGQQLLNSFVEQLALDLPRFLRQSAKEKTETLLNVIGVGDKLHELERAESEAYDQRTAIGRIADQKEKFVKEMPVYTGVPATPVSASKLIKQQQEILAKNGENQRKRQQKKEFEKQLEKLKSDLLILQNQIRIAENNYEIACKSAQDLTDESTEAIERSIDDIEAVNLKVYANLEREKAEADAESYREQYERLTEKIEDIRSKKKKLLDGADLPLSGLTVENGELRYNGYNWDCMSGSEQLIVATSIVRKLNPHCGFVLIDKLEQMDMETVRAFGHWLEEQGLQAIATRVSTGEECSIIIEDGYARSEAADNKEWKAGTF